MKHSLLIFIYLFTFPFFGQVKLNYSVLQNKQNSIDPWSNAYKQTYTYNVSNQLVERIDEDWNSIDNKWLNDYKYVYTYTTDGAIKSETLYRYSSNFNKWDEDEKSIYTYNAFGDIDLLEYYDYNSQNSKWEIEGKTEYFYNTDRKIIEYFDYNWDGSEWRQSYKTTIAYNERGKINLVNEYNPIEEGSSVLGNSYRTSYIYDTNGKLIDTISEEFSDENWISDYKTTYEIDSFGNYKKITDNDSETITFTYDNSKLMSNFVHPFSYSIEFLSEIGGSFPYYHKILEEVDTRFSGYSSKTTYHYSDEIVAAIEEFENSIIKIYPNPVTNFINIETNEKITSLQIIDMRGKILLQTTETKIDLQSLTPGLYVVKIEANSGKIMRKRIIKN